MARGDFDATAGQIELINGRLVHINPQGPLHSNPIDLLNEWSILQAHQLFRIRIEKPLSILLANSCPEPDVVWVTRRQYADRHPLPEEVHLLVEVSFSSVEFDRSEKLKLYAAAQIPEYWQVDIPSRTVSVYREPVTDRYQSHSQHIEADVIRPLCLPSAELKVRWLFAE